MAFPAGGGHRSGAIAVTRCGRYIQPFAELFFVCSSGMKLQLGLLKQILVFLDPLKQLIDSLIEIDLGLPA